MERILFSNDVTRLRSEDQNLSETSKIVLEYGNKRGLSHGYSLKIPLKFSILNDINIIAFKINFLCIFTIDKQSFA